MTSDIIVAFGFKVMTLTESSTFKKQFVEVNVKVSHDLLENCLNIETRFLEICPCPDEIDNPFNPF